MCLCGVFDTTSDVLPQTEELEAQLKDSTSTMEILRPEIETLRSDSVRLRLDLTTATTAQALAQQSVTDLMKQLDDAWVREFLFIGHRCRVVSRRHLRA